MLGASRVCPQISVVQASLIGELTEAIVKGFAEGGAVFEGRNLEGVADHVDVFAGHKNDEEANDGENRFTISPGADVGAGTDKGNSETVRALKRVDSG